jgi:hypothetical protein
VDDILAHSITGTDFFAKRILFLDPANNKPFHKGFFSVVSPQGLKALLRVSPGRAG